MTNVEDLQSAARLGADYGGLVVEYPPSPRSISLNEAMRLARFASIPLVAVVVDLDVEYLVEVAESIQAHGIQLAGSQGTGFTQELRDRLTRTELWKVLHLSPNAESAEIEALVYRAKDYLRSGVDKIMVDARLGERPGGTGRSVDWATVRELSAAIGRPVILAGGLNPDNVARAIASARPIGVDVSSGIETSTGIKDYPRMERFTLAAREAFARTSV